MPEIENLLVDVAAELEWPETPPLSFSAPALRIAARRRWLPALVAAVVLAVGAALLVPGARSAILDWLRIGGVAVERVETLPDGLPAATFAAIGPEVSADQATAILGTAFARLPGEPSTPLRARDGVVSTVVDSADGPVLVAQLRSTDLVLVLKKLAGATSVEVVSLAPDVLGAWLSGAQHALIGPTAPPRLAGNVLVWERAGITFRLEGPRLRRATAFALARGLGAR